MISVFAKLLSRAIDEAKISPPSQRLNPMLSAVEISRDFAAYGGALKLSKRHKLLTEQHQKFLKTSKVEHLIQAAERQVRARYLTDILQLPAEMPFETALRPRGLLHQMGRPARPRSNKVNIFAKSRQIQERASLQAARPLAKSSHIMTSGPNNSLSLEFSGRDYVDPEAAFLSQTRPEHLDLLGLPRPSKEQSRNQQTQTMHANAVDADLPRLSFNAPIENAPSMGPRTAAILEQLGLRTVRDLLTCDPEQIAKQVSVSFITAQALRKWRKQSELMCSIAQLTVLDVQILVALGFENIETVAHASPALLEDQLRFLVEHGEGAALGLNVETFDPQIARRWISLAQNSLTDQNFAA